MNAPTLQDIYQARARLHGVIRPTPLMRHPLLVKETGLEVYIKHENHNPTGAFKIRGGLNLIASLTDAERACGVITASTGNHGQSISLAAQRARVACTVAVPQGNNPENATRVTFDLTFEILKRELDDIVTLSESELKEGVRLALRTTHNLAEGAGSASLMAAMGMRDRLQGKKVACVMSGGNMDTAVLQRILANGSGDATGPAGFA